MPTLSAWLLTNVAVTAVLDEIVIVQPAVPWHPDPFQPVPDQPANDDPPAGIAVSVTEVPLA
jgi:hypothetical protein